MPPFIHHMVSLSRPCRFRRRSRLHALDLLAHAEALPADGADAADAAVELAVAEADHGVADHAGVGAQDAGDIALRGDAGIVAQREVVARRVAHLMRRRCARQREDAPVGQAPDHALLPQNQLARRLYDSVRREEKGLARPGFMVDWRKGEGEGKLGMEYIREGRGRRDEDERGGAGSLSREPATQYAGDSFSIATQPHHAVHRPCPDQHSSPTLPRCLPPNPSSQTPRSSECNVLFHLSQGVRANLAWGELPISAFSSFFSFPCLPAGGPEGPRGGTLHGGRRARVCELTMPINSYSISAVRVRCIIVTLRVRVWVVVARIVRSLRLVVPVRVVRFSASPAIRPRLSNGRLGNERSSALFCFAGAGG